MIVFAFVFLKSTIVSAACSEEVIEALQNHSHQDSIQKAAREYNSLLDKSLSKRSRQSQIEVTLDHMETLNPSFPKDAFLQWLISTKKFEAPFSKKSIGEFIQDHAIEFQKAHPTVNMSDFINDTKTLAKKLRAQCLGDPSCKRTKIEEFVLKFFKDTPCVLKSKNKIVLRNMISTILFYEAGLSYKYLNADGQDKEFQWDLLLNQLLWSPIMATKQCRDLEHSIEAAGKKIDPSQDTVAIAKGATGNRPSLVKQYFNILKWTPLQDATYLALHMVSEKAHGREVNTDPAYIGNQVASLVAWDTLFAVPRSVATGNLFNVQFTKYGKFLEGIIPSPVLRETAYTATDLGARFVIYGGNAGIQATYMDYVKTLWSNEK